MASQNIQIGLRVRVINPELCYYGRIGLVEAPASDDEVGGGEGNSIEWHVVLDYPLGGTAGRAVLGEDELEVVSGNLDPKAMFRA